MWFHHTDRDLNLVQPHLDTRQRVLIIMVGLSAELTLVLTQKLYRSSNTYPYPPVIHRKRRAE